MAWDPQSTRGRQNSKAAISSGQDELPDVQATKAKSAHVSDPALQPFLEASFDPTGYLNATLPSLKTPNPSQSSNTSVPLAELSTQTQTLLSQLSAHTTRLTTTLTQLTDEILKSGSKLAYEVEVLRGETLGLSEALSEGLRDDVRHFCPDGLEVELAKKPAKPVDPNGTRRRSSTLLTPKTPTTPKFPPHEDAAISRPAEPEYIKKLRTLTLVRERLDTVVKTFGDAMEWTFPPSEVSVSSTFLSVSALEPGSDTHSTEERGKQVSKELRDEIADLLVGQPDPVDGIEAAAKRVEELKDLAGVWKGTAEEKARVKFVESLAKMVEDRHRDLLRVNEQSSRHDQLPAEILPTSGSAESRTLGGYGFISQLQKLRGGS